MIKCSKWIKICMYTFLYFEVRVRCREKSSRPLSHLLMSYLYNDWN